MARRKKGRGSAGARAAKTWRGLLGLLHHQMRGEGPKDEREPKQNKELYCKKPSGIFHVLVFL